MMQNTKMIWEKKDKEEIKSSLKKSENVHKLLSLHNEITNFLWIQTRDLHKDLTI